MRLTHVLLSSLALAAASALSCSGSSGDRGTLGTGDQDGPAERPVVAPAPGALVVEAEAASSAPPPMADDGASRAAAVPVPPEPSADRSGSGPGSGAYAVPGVGEGRSGIVTATPGGPPPSMGPADHGPAPIAESAPMAAPPPAATGGRPTRRRTTEATRAAPPSREPAARADSPRPAGGGRGASRSGGGAGRAPAESAAPSSAPAPAPYGSVARDEASVGSDMDSGGYYGGGGVTLGAPEPYHYPQPYVVQRILTAATVADVDRRPEYLGYLARHPYEASVLGLDMSRRVRFRVIDGASRPVHDAVLTLVGPGFHVQGVTHADGFWDFFPGVGSPQAGGPTTVYIQALGQTAQAAVQIPHQGDGQDIYIRLPQALAASAPVLDLAFLVDVTGSMGDELRYVNEEVVGIVQRVRASVPGVAVRVAATFYRDRGDLIPIEQIPFSTDMGAFVSRMRYVEASGGGDYPEDLNLGLAAALTTLDWSRTPAVRVLVVIADAPPQRYPGFQYTYHTAMMDASRRGIRILPVAASGADRVTEFLFRAMGAYTSSPYVYLTDDSGVGGSHMEADTESVSVEMFSDSLTRLLVSDLRGHGMHEPGVSQMGIGGQLQ